MARLESFTNLSRKQEDLLNKGYCYGTLGLAVFSHRTADLLFKTRIGKRFGGAVVSNMSGSFKHGDLTFTPKQKTDGSHLVSFEYNPDKDNKLKGELKLVTDAKGAVVSNEPTISVEHSQDNLKVKVAVTKGPVAKLNGTFGRTDIGFGVETKLALNALALPKLNLASWYNLSKTNMLFKLDGLDIVERTVEKISASLLLNVNPTVRFGSLVTFDEKTKTVSAEFGGDYQLTEKTLVKGKVDNVGTIGVAVHQQLNEHVKLSIASQVASAKVVGNALSDFKFGFRFDFTD